MLSNASCCVQYLMLILKFDFSKRTGKKGNRAQ